MNNSLRNIFYKIRPIGNVIPFLIFFFMAYSVYSAQRGRPKIENNTIVTDQGTRLRGGTFWLYGWMPSKTAWALCDTPWTIMVNTGFNAIRLACGYRPEHTENYSLAQYDTILDKVIDRAAKNGIYAIIDYHPTPGYYYNVTGSTNSDTYENNRKYAIDFWTRIANRYKDKTNVIFELINEPIFDSPDNYNDTLLSDFENLWRICNSAAPEVPIIVLTFCQVGSHQSHLLDWPSNVAAELNGIDWKKTVVGFHNYWRDSSTRIVDLKEHYPCFCTEFMYPGSSSEIKVMDGYAYHGTLMEKLGISWLQWDILDRKESVEQKLPKVIQNLKDSSAFWPKDSAQMNLATSNLSTCSKKASSDANLGSKKKVLLIDQQQNESYKNSTYYYLNGKVMRTINASRKIPVIIIK